MVKYDKEEYANRNVKIKVRLLADFRKAVTDYHDGRIRDNFTTELNAAIENHIILLNRRTTQIAEERLRSKTEIRSKT
jgi:hypothetical protein